MKKLVVILILSTTLSWSQRMWTDDDHQLSMRGHGRIVENLKLTEDQQKQFDKIHTDLEKKQITLRSKLETMQVDLRDLIRSEKPDQGKIESQLSEISKTQNEMKMNRMGRWFGINKILTPEQQNIWKDHPIMIGKGGGPQGHKPWKRDGMKHRGRSGRMMHHEQRGRCCN